MNRRFRLAIVALAVVAIVAAGAFVFAQGGPPPQRAGRGQMMGQGPGGRGPGMMGLGQLNLTDDQRAQIQKLMEANRQAHQPEQQKMADAQKALRDAIFADAGPDESAIQTAQAQIQALEPQMAQHRVATEVAIAKILTADQRKQMREMPRMGPGAGRGRGMMRPGRF
jgi:Spy/CpxP family protein refolding chaperone